MSEWRRNPPTMHQRRGDGRSGAQRGAAEAGDSGEQRSGEGRGQQRDSIADGTALRYIVGEEVAATLERVLLDSLFLCLLRYSLHVAVRTEGTDVYCRVVW